jgi:opacity protein-like surface antigen
MARIAYEYAVIPRLAVYAEFLPGYSIISLPSSVTFLGEKPPSPKGFVLDFGAGAAFDITDQFFVNLGIGYQMGWQNTSGGGGQDYKTRFLRIALGGGVKF